MLEEPAYLGQNCRTPYPRTEIVMRLIWSIVEATLFRLSPRPLHAFRARLLSLFGAEIPRPSEVVIFPSVHIVFPWKLTLEPHSMLGPQVVVYNLARVSLRRGANVSQRTHLCAGTHDYSLWSMPVAAAPIVIGENAWVAADVFVGPGVSIGDLSVVGARSVVVKDLPARRVCVGNPCRPVKIRPDPR